MLKYIKLINKLLKDAADIGEVTDEDLEFLPVLTDIEVPSQLLDTIKGVYYEVDDKMKLNRMEIAPRVYGAILAASAHRVVVRTRRTRVLQRYHKLLEYILRTCNDLAIEPHFVDDCLNFSKYPYRNTMHQLVYLVGKDKGLGDIRPRLWMLVGLLTTRDGVKLPKSIPLISACRDLYFRSRITPTLQDTHELWADKLSIFNWLNHQLDQAYQRHADNSIEHVRDEVHFLAWYTLLILLSRTKLVPGATTMLNEVYNALTERYKCRVLK